MERERNNMTLTELYNIADYTDNKGMLFNRDILEVLPQIEDNTVNLIVTDPPYKITSRGTSGTMGGYWKSDIAKKGKIFNNNDISCKDYLSEFYRILKDKSILYIMCNNINLQEMINEGTRVGFRFVKSLIWEKGNKICGKYYMGCFEYILLFRKGGDRPINNCGTPDILKYPIKKLKDENGKNLHDTEKPIDLMKVLIENSSNENDIIFEPFMGIGSTILACKELNRRYIGVEIDKIYFDIAKKRINNEICRE